MLLKANLTTTRIKAQKILKRRQAINKTVVDEVRKTKVSGSTNIKEVIEVDIPPWKKYMMEKYPDFYCTR